MVMKRTTVFADENDLAALKAAAARRGVTEAELLRDAIHLVALAERRWQEPLFSRTYTSVGGERAAEEVLDAVWSEKAHDYESDKRHGH